MAFFSNPFNNNVFNNGHPQWIQASVNNDHPFVQRVQASVNSDHPIQQGAQASTNYDDGATIFNPRLAPHRTGLLPAKSCLKKGRAQEKSIAARRRKKENNARIALVKGPGDHALARCIQTGHPVPSSRRLRQQWEAETRQARKARARLTRYQYTRPDWTSDLDEPMTGVSLSEDFAAAQHRSEEDELDRRHQLALLNSRLNKADCPINNPNGKPWRSNHPEVVRSRAEMMTGTTIDQDPIPTTRHSSRRRPHHKTKAGGPEASFLRKPAVPQVKPNPGPTHDQSRRIRKRQNTRRRQHPRRSD
ncbi:hypothetical protein OQA88_7653 [Cercophora sp. LCS_1]